MIKPYQDGHCTTCSRKLFGRSDKVYCDETCKNALHEITRKFTKHIQHHKNKNVIRNYILCEGQFRHKTKEVIVHQDTLFKYGFDINAFDLKHVKKTRVIYQILEYKFEILKNGKVKIWRTKRTKEYPDEFLRRYEREFPDGCFGVEYEEKEDTDSELGVYLGKNLQWYFKRTAFFICKSLTAKSFIDRRFNTFHPT